MCFLDQLLHSTSCVSDQIVSKSNFRHRSACRVRHHSKLLKSLRSSQHGCVRRLANVETRLRIGGGRRDAAVWSRRSRRLGVEGDPASADWKCLSTSAEPPMKHRPDAPGVATCFRCKLRSAGCVRARGDTASRSAGRLDNGCDCCGAHEEVDLVRQDGVVRRGRNTVAAPTSCAAVDDDWRRDTTRSLAIDMRACRL